MRYHEIVAARGERRVLAADPCRRLLSTRRLCSLVLMCAVAVPTVGCQTTSKSAGSTRNQSGFESSATASGFSCSHPHSSRVVIRVVNTTTETFLDRLAKLRFPSSSRLGRPEDGRSPEVQLADVVCVCSCGCIALICDEITACSIVRISYAIDK